MKAILVDKEFKLYLGEADRPTPGKNEVLIRNKATSLNRMDLLQKIGKYPLPEGASPILGVDCAGVVEEIGEKVTKFKVGDEVFGLLQGGGYAEYCINHEELLWIKPKKLSFEEAASVPEVFMTAYQTLFLIGGLTPQKRVLVHAGASGVGSAAIQLCGNENSKTYFTAGSEEKIEYCLKLGESKGINYKSESFLDIIGKNNIDIILDFVGASHFSDNIDVLDNEGTLVVISFLSGKDVKLDLSKVLRKWIKIEGTTLRARSEEYRIELARNCGEYILPRLENGKLKPFIDKIFNWKDVAAAHQMMQENKNLGKLVLTID